MALIPQIDNGLQLSQNRQKTLPSKTYKLVHDVIASKLQLNEPSVVVADFITLNDIAYDKFSMKPVGTSYQETKDEVPGTAVSGEDITITDAQVLPLHKFNIEGKNVQETREGYNKAKYTNQTTEKNFQIGDIESGKTYSLYLNINGYISFNLRYGTSSGTLISTKYSINGKRVYVFTATESGVLYFNGFTSDAGAFVSVDEIMLLEGEYTLETLPTYEKYGASPSIEYEAPIESVGDNINLLPLNNVEEINKNGLKYSCKNGKLTINGTATALTNIWFNDLDIKMNVGEYTLSSNTNLQGKGSVALKDLNGNIVQTNLSASAKITLDKNTTATQFLIQISSGATFTNFEMEIKLEKGTKATPYSPYGQGSIGIYNCNKNLFNKNTIRERHRLGSDGADYSDINYFVSDYIAIKENIKCVKNTPIGIYYAVSYYDKDKKHIARNTTENPFVTPEGTCYMRVCDLLTNLDTLQLEKGETATEYIAHQSQTKALYTQQPFRAIGDVKDRFVKQNGVWYEEHKIFRKIFNGTEPIQTLNNYATSHINTVLFSWGLPEKWHMPKSLTPMLSNYFMHNKNIWGSDVEAVGNTEKHRIEFSISKDRFEGTSYSEMIEELKTKLMELYNAGTPVIVDIQLAIPELIECTSEQTEQLNYLNNEFKTYEGINHITTTNEIKPTLSFTYNFIPALPSLEAESPIISTGDNVNLLDSNNYIINNLPNVSIIRHADGYFIINGTTDAYGGDIRIIYDNPLILPAGEYNFTFGNLGTNIFNNELNITSLGKGTYQLVKRIAESLDSILITFAEDYQLYNYNLHLAPNLTLNNLIIYPKISKSKSKSYSPYGMGGVPIKQVNKNFLDLTKKPYDENSSVLNGAKVTLNGGVLNVDATNSTGAVTIRSIWADYKRSSTILLPKGTYYTALILNITGVESLNSKQVGGGTFTLEEDCYLTQWFFNVAQGNKSTKVLQIEQGEKQTDYIEHQSQTKVLYTQQPFRGIGDVKDRFVKQNSVWYEEHNIARKILNGSETTWYLTVSNEAYCFWFRNNTIENCLLAKHKKYCNYFQYEETGFETATNPSLCENSASYNEHNFMFIFKTDGTLGKTVDEWKAKLTELYNAGTPVYVDYVLATPKLIECTPEQIAVLEEQDINSDLIHIYSTDDIPTDIEVTYYSSKDVQMVNVNSDRIVGYADGLEAVKQSIFHILNVERYAYIIYNNNYGVELEQYIGADINYIEATIENTLKEALTYDLRIKDVKVQSVTQITHDIVLVNFVCYTIYGDLVMEVNINV